MGEHSGEEPTSQRPQELASSVWSMGKVRGMDESMRPQEEGRVCVCVPLLTHTLREALGKCNSPPVSFTVK